MNKGSKYKSGQRPTFRIWDNEKNDWFEPTYEGWDGKIEELLLSPTGDLTMRTFTDFKHESVFPERFEIVLDEPQKISWRKAISVLEQHFQCEIPINLDNVVKGYREMSGILNTVEFELSKRNSELTAKEFIFEALESKKHKVKVPLHVGNWVEYSKDEGWDFLRSTEEMTGPMGDGSVRIWFKKNSDKYAEAWSNDFEIEEVAEWVVRVKGMYFLNWGEDGTYPTFVIDDNPGAKHLAKPFIKSEAQSLAESLHGSIEKV
ncbi:hypothetical protein [Enterococcus avium]|uniref:hypothetical protein n=1 Tax=Enterococcus avium TaxID=33945 RepID=UPI0032E52FA1